MQQNAHKIQQNAHKMRTKYNKMHTQCNIMLCVCVFVGLVRTYDELVTWLVGLAPDRIRRTELDFEGRNIVLWSPGCQLK